MKLNYKFGGMTFNEREKKPIFISSKFFLKKNEFEGTEMNFFLLAILDISNEHEKDILESLVFIHS